MANDFGAPPSPYPDMGGDSDIPPWLQALINRQAGPMAGQIPGQDTFSTTTPTAGGGNQPPPGPLAANAAPGSVMPNAGAQNPYGIQRGGAFGGPLDFPTNTAGAPSMGYPALNYQGKLPGAHDAPPPPDSQPAQRQQGKQQPQQQKPPPVKKPGPAQPVSAGPQGAVDAASPTASPAASNMPYPGQQDPQGVWGPRPDASVTTPVADPDMLYPHRMIAGAPSNGAVPNLGYYTGPTSGNVQQASSFRYTDPNDPRIYRGPLAAPPAAAAAPPPPPAAAAAPAGAGPGPIAPGVGTLWLRKLFGGGQPAA